MKAKRAVVDTNILHAGLYSSKGASFQILRLVAAERLIPILSTTLVFEYEEVLKRNKAKLNLSNSQIDGLLNEFCLLGEARKVHFLWRPQLSDPKDDHLLELAVSAGNADIVTHNIKDFAKARPFGIRILTPAQMLGEMK